jgi:hypothetical protein
MKKLIFKTSKRKRLHFTFDDRNPICSVKHKHKSSAVIPGTSKESNCKNCVRVWKSLKKKRRIEFLKSIGKIK